MTDQELKQLVESNSRAIQALTDNIAELTNDVHIFVEESKQGQAELRQGQEQLRQVIIGIANLLASLDEDRPTILRRLMSIENKVDRLLEQGEGEQNQ